MQPPNPTFFLGALPNINNIMQTKQWSSNWDIHMRMIMIMPNIICKWYTAELSIFLRGIMNRPPSLDVPDFWNLPPIAFLKMVQQLQVLALGEDLETFRTAQCVLFGPKR